MEEETVGKEVYDRITYLEDGFGNSSDPLLKLRVNSGHTRFQQGFSMHEAGVYGRSGYGCDFRCGLYFPSVGLKKEHMRARHRG